MVGGPSRHSNADTVAHGPSRWGGLGGRSIHPGGGPGPGRQGGVGGCDNSAEVPVPVPPLVEAAMTVDPTLDAATASQRVWDAVVVGAGPAGAMAARELARF